MVKLRKHCPYCNKFFYKEKARLKHINEIHSGDSKIYLFLKMYDKVVRMGQSISLKIEDNVTMDSDELARKLNLMELDMKILKNRKSNIKYIDSIDAPFMPMSDKDYERWKEIQMWQQHNPRLEKKKKKLEGYGIDHDAVMEELKIRLAKQRLD